MKLRKYGLALVVLGLMVAMLPLAAGATAQETCPEGGGWYKVDLQEDDILTYTFDEADFPEVDFDALFPDGYTITDNCFKAANEVVEGSGDTVTNTTVYNKPEGQPGRNLQDISHASFLLVAIPDEPDFDLEVEKVWDGDEVDLEGITVTFEFDPSDTELEDGEEVTITEVVEGELPEGCAYTSDLDDISPYTVNKADAVEGLISLTVTNTVECEEDEDVVPPPDEEEQEGTTTTVTVPEDEVSGTTLLPVIVPQVPSTVATQLPFTGIEDTLPKAGLALFATGALLVLLARGRRQDEELLETEV